MNFNKAIVLGNITRDPELRTTQSGAKVCTFSIATNRTYNKDGQKVEEVEFHNIVVFGPMGENIAQYMRRGNQILIEGRIQTRGWEGSDGVKKTRTEIIGENVQFGAKPATAGQTAPSRESVQPVHREEAQPVPRRRDEDIDVEDIPF